MPDQTPGPHPSQVIAAALGTQPHLIDREALAKYRAGHVRAAEAAQEEAAEKIAETTAPPDDGVQERSTRK